MTDPLICVVIPFYNGARFLKDALSMLMAQTLKPDEIIIVDDGSDSENAHAAARIVADFTCVRLVHQENAGPGAARNRGVRESSGDLLAFLDVDDDWAKVKLAKQVAWFRDHPDLDLILTESNTLSETGVIETTSSLAALSKKNLVENVLQGKLHSFTSTIMVKKEFFFRIGGFENTLRFREDHLFILRTFLEGNFAVIPEVLSYRRMHLDSMSGAGSNPDPRLSLIRAQLFWQEAEKYIPDLQVTKLSAHEFDRLARKYVVLGEPWKAIRASCSAFLSDPSSPRHLVYIVAALWVQIQPSRFDYWNNGFAQLRRKRRKRNG